MADESQHTSIKARISALNLEQVGAVPGAPPPYSYEAVASKKARPPPPPPPGQRPNPALRSQTVNNPPVQSSSSVNESTQSRAAGVLPAPMNVLPAPKSSSAAAASNAAANARPTLPPRPSRTSTTPAVGEQHQQKAPALPPRRPSESPSLGARKPSVESIASTVSARSSVSGMSVRTASSATTNGTAAGRQFEIRAPPFDPSKLPPLPPKREKEDEKPTRPGARATLARVKTSPSVVAAAARTVKAPLLPPPVPKRDTPGAARTNGSEDAVVDNAPPALPLRPSLPSRPAATTTRPVRSALDFAMNKSTETPPPMPTRPATTTNDTPIGAPPPVPLSSRPNLAALQASKPKLTDTSTSCLHCRDFSGPDTHATRFPRASIPSSDLGWLAQQLTSPFPSPTDKARAIFTWLHHNIDYNVAAFFSGNVQPSTPASTLQTGLAVCEGYAGLFAALAAKAGLDALVVTGHGKGFGHGALAPGSPCPPRDATGHAWNAFRDDGGVWKLIDCCWGAGNVRGHGMPYNRDFNPNMFTMGNDEFGAKHFPADAKMQFRSDGRAISWEEYMQEDMVAGGRPTIAGAVREHGIGERTFEPATKQVAVRGGPGEMVRFTFAAVCRHWDNAVRGAGKPCVMVLKVGGRDGRKDDFLPFECSGPVGSVWWLDVRREELGAPGQQIWVYAVTVFDGRDAKGLSLEEFKRKKGRVGMEFAGIAQYELV